jgi:hypothetical protein
MLPKFRKDAKTRNITNVECFVRLVPVKPRASSSFNYEMPKPWMWCSSASVASQEAKRVAIHAGDRGLAVMPHCWKSAIGIAASVHSQPSPRPALAGGFGFAP